MNCTEAEKALLVEIFAPSDQRGEKRFALESAVLEERMPPEFFERCVCAEREYQRAKAAREAISERLAELGFIGTRMSIIFERIKAAAKEKP